MILFIITVVLSNSLLYSATPCTMHDRDTHTCILYMTAAIAACPSEACNITDSFLHNFYPDDIKAGQSSINNIKEWMKTHYNSPATSEISRVAIYTLCGIICAVHDQRHSFKGVDLHQYLNFLNPYFIYQGTWSSRGQLLWLKTSIRALRTHASIANLGVGLDEIKSKIAQLLTSSSSAPPLPVDTFFLENQKSTFIYGEDALNALNHTSTPCRPTSQSDKATGVNLFVFLEELLKHKKCNNTTIDWGKTLQSRYTTPEMLVYTAPIALYNESNEIFVSELHRSTLALLKDGSSNCTISRIPQPVCDALNLPEQSISHISISFVQTLLDALPALNFNRKLYLRTIKLCDMFCISQHPSFSHKLFRMLLGTSSHNFGLYSYHNIAVATLLWTSQKGKADMPANLLLSLRKKPAKDVRSIIFAHCSKKTSQDILDAYSTLDIKHISTTLKTRLDRWSTQKMEASPLNVEERMEHVPLQCAVAVPLPTVAGQPLEGLPVDPLQEDTNMESSCSKDTHKADVHITEDPNNHSIEKTLTHDHSMSAILKATKPHRPHPYNPFPHLSFKAAARIAQHHTTPVKNSSLPLLLPPVNPQLAPEMYHLQQRLFFKDWLLQHTHQ